MSFSNVCIIDESGNRRWYSKGRLHRLKGPACEYVGGTKCWFIWGKLHRLEGPALEYNDGNKEYWIESKECTEEEFKEKIKI